MGTPPRVMKTRRQGRISASLTLWLVVVWLMLFHELTPLTVVSGILTAVGIQLHSLSYAVFMDFGVGDGNSDRYRKFEVGKF